MRVRQVNAIFFPQILGLNMFAKLGPFSLLFFTFIASHTAQADSYNFKAALLEKVKETADPVCSAGITTFVDRIGRYKIKTATSTFDFEAGYRDVSEEEKKCLVKGTIMALNAMYVQEHLADFEALVHFERVFHQVISIAKKILPEVDFNRFLISKYEKGVVFNLLTLRGTRSILVKREQIRNEEVSVVFSSDFTKFVHDFDANEAKNEVRLITNLGNHQIPLILRKDGRFLYLVSLDSGGFLGKQQWSLQLFNKLLAYHREKEKFKHVIKLIAPKERKQTDSVSCPQYAQEDIHYSFKRDYFTFFTTNVSGLTAEPIGLSIPLNLMPPELMLNAQSFTLLKRYSDAATPFFGEKEMDEFWKDVIRNSVIVYDKESRSLKHVNIRPRRAFFNDATFLINLILK